MTKESGFQPLCLEPKTEIAGHYGGIDKNPIAMELAEVSLWLNCIYRDRYSIEETSERGQTWTRTVEGEVFVPWLGLQL